MCPRCGERYLSERKGRGFVITKTFDGHTSHDEITIFKCKCGQEYYLSEYVEIERKDRCQGSQKL